MRCMMPASLAAVFLSVLPIGAQIKAPSLNPLPASIVPHPDWPKAAPGDVDTVDHLVNALSGVISETASQPRKWDRFRSLFLPTGRLGVIRPAMPAVGDKPGFAGDVVLFTPDTYAERDTPYFA